MNANTIVVLTADEDFGAVAMACAEANGWECSVDGDSIRLADEIGTLGGKIAVIIIDLDTAAYGSFLIRALVRLAGAAPALVVSHYAPQFILPATAHGLVRWLMKPVSPKELEAALKDCCPPLAATDSGPHGEGGLLD